MDNFDNFISDEMLAAYIDGNAYPIERNLVEEHIENENMCEILDIISDIESNPELGESIENIPLDSRKTLYRIGYKSQRTKKRYRTK